MLLTLSLILLIRLLILDTLTCSLIHSLIRQHRHDPSTRQKTFLIAAILAMKHPRLTIFLGGSAALVIMTVLSAVLGHVVPNLISRKYTQFMAAILFLVFGLKMLKEGFEMDPNEAQKEMEEVDQELAERESQRKRKNHDVELDQLEDGYLDGVGRTKSSAGSSFSDPLTALVNLAQFLFTPIFVQTFIMTFLGEWGDRSQVSC